MKKIFALLFSLGTLTSVFAQSGHSRDIAMNQGKSTSYSNSERYDSYTMSTKERDAQIAQIERAFDLKIKAVKKDRHLKSFEKNRQVRQLEMQRDQQIKQVNDRFSDRRNAQYNDHSSKSNNWKH